MTGLPLNGIVTNFRNIYIVYMTLFDYYFIKGNQAFYKSSLVVFVGILVSSVNQRVISQFKGREDKLNKMRKSFLSKNRIINSLKPYDLFMKYRMGLATYDMLREFLAINSSSDYHLPSTMDGILEEYSRLMNNALVSVA